MHVVDTSLELPDFRKLCRSRHVVSSSAYAYVQNVPLCSCETRGEPMHSTCYLGRQEQGTMHSHSRAHRAKKGDNSLLERICKGWRNVDVFNSKRHSLHPYFVERRHLRTLLVLPRGRAERTAVAREKAEGRALPKVLPQWAQVPSQFFGRPSCSRGVQIRWAIRFLRQHALQEVRTAVAHATPTVIVGVSKYHLQEVTSATLFSLSDSSNLGLMLSRTATLSTAWICVCIVRGGIFRGLCVFLCGMRRNH